MRTPRGVLVYGQIYPLLLVGLVVGWIAERRGHPVPAALLYGVVVALKPSLGPILLLMLVQRRWRPLRAAVLAGALATGVGLLVAGPSSGLAWLRIVLTEPVPNTVGNASLLALAVRFGLPPVLGALAGIAVLAGTLVFCARHRGQINPAGTAPWAVLAAGLLLSPIAWHTYLLLLTPGILMLIAQRRPMAASAAFAAGAVPVSWHAEWPPDGLGAAASGSLNCAILLGYWLVLLHATRTNGALPHRLAESAAPPGLR